MAVTSSRSTSAIATGWRRSRFTTKFPACRGRVKLVAAEFLRDDETARRAAGSVAGSAAGAVRQRLGARAGRAPPPPPAVTRAHAERHFLAALELWDQIDRALLPERRTNLFAKHPRMGDLTIEEWMRFHRIHARHHARQIRGRVGTWG